MAKGSGLAQAFFIGGRDLSGDVGSLSRCGSLRALHDVTGLNQSAIHRVNGLADGVIEFNPWFNDAAAQEHIALRGLPTADVIVLYANRSLVDAAAAGLVAKQMNYDWTRPADGSLAGVVQALANGTPLEWGVMLTAGSITHASATSAASKDDAASSANGIVGYLQVVSIATGTPTFVIEESSDNGVGDAWTAKLSFAAVAQASAPTAERLTATGTVERYLRATTTGTFTNAVFAIMYRRGTAQDDVAL